MAGIDTLIVMSIYLINIKFFFNSIYKLSLICLIIFEITACSSINEKESQPQQIRATPAVKYALSLKGTPYNYGSDIPEQGFDCSGFVKHVYEKQGIYLPRKAYDMAFSLPAIAKDKVQTGDLVFFDVNGKPYSHVGIYISNDQFIHAPSEKTGKVLVSTLKNDYWEKRYRGVRRPFRKH